MFGYIKEHISRNLVIDAIEKTNSSYWNIITFVPVFFIDKGGNTANKFSIIAFSYPPGCFAVAECFILFFIKYI